MTDFATDAEERLGGRVLHVRSDALEQLQRRIEALGRRARRIAVEPVRLIDTGERDASGHALVVLSGRAPVLAGWTLAAIVEHRDGGAAVRPAGEQGARLAREMSFVYGLAVIPRDEHAARQLRGSRYSWSRAPAGWQDTGPRARRAARLGLARAGDRSLTATPMIAIAAGNATRQRRTGSSSTRAGAETATNPPDGPIRAGDRASVGAMFGSRAPIAKTVAVSAHAAEQYQHRVKPRLDLAAARGELERLRALGEISAQEPAWLNAATPAPDYLLIDDAIVLPLLPQGGGWVATTCVTQRTLTPTRRSAKSARKASLAARKRAQRRARS